MVRTLSLLQNQWRSENPSNQEFEEIKLITIVSSLDNFGISFLTSKFWFSTMSYCKCHSRWSIKHARPFLLNKKYTRENKHLLELYVVLNYVTLSPKETIYIFVTQDDLVGTFWRTWMIQTLQICISRVSIPNNERKTKSEQRNKIFFP